MSETQTVENGANGLPPGPGAGDRAVGLTASAAARIAHLMKEEDNPAAFLRVSVTGGGCSGFQYNFSFDEDVQDDDLVIERDGAVVHVDQVSLDLMAGSVIDYVEDMLAASFQVKNPNASSSCGCGSSFAI
ncbi:iron-sulfur cluster insertion protein ErpA [Zavarzinia compransoris]|uniref:iron-sulfur cluster insertion protein ErpA n=1 Tax=Zavarzinia marina TaxID=2911065 RepID=UPI001EEBAA56|nr:iron-sulfur cluster insertion protein ErpA [Zavarzinia marina]MCF4164420.1 iron-sulfur cluster insertion protein ErpA [Zavarzinia marina]